MANKVLRVEPGGTPDQIVFADHAGDFSPTAANDLRDATSGNRTNVEFNPASLAGGAYYQSDKVDLGSLWAPAYNVRAAIEWVTTVDAAEGISLFWAPSQSATAGTANPGGVSGAKGSYTGYSANAADSSKSLQFIGKTYSTNQGTSTVQIFNVGTFSPPNRYGSLVLRNDADDAFHSDDVEIHVVFDPVVDEVQ